MILAAGLAAPVSAQTAPPAQPSEENMARCQQLFGIWSRHNGTHGYGRVLDGDMAIEQCRKGEYAAGVAQLKTLLQRQRLPIPPVESAQTR
jgi:hypothetical protein